ncbi:Bug family tripartite tricarboxylate transporter substrate binding protein [Bordetella tumulicola]|uniref:Bug family tripartite tricarboxylate transporter substrate binding protein n=1 Tax=Bordetella tumulicola TaxID=1649133 RepID=UPI0039F129E4
MLSPSRRLFLAGALASALVAGSAAHAANTQTTPFPTKTVTLYTAFSVGSGPDVVLRILSQELSKVWKQSVVVENRPGGGGFIALSAVGKLPADGYALLQLDSEHVSALPHLYKSRNYVTLEKFDLVAPLFYTPFMIAVGDKSPWKNITDLVSAARAKPDTVTYGSWFVGSPGHLGGEWLSTLTDTKMVHVPYKEVSQLYTAVANGEVDWAFGTIPSTRPVYDSGKLRYLAIAAPQRSVQYPNVPTVAEAGGPAELDVNSIVSLLAPKGIPDEVRDKIYTDVTKILADPAIRKRFDTFAFEPLTWPLSELRKRLDEKSDTYKGLIGNAKISLD